MFMSVLHGLEHAALTWTYSIDMEQRHGNSAWTWTISMDMDIQHGHGYAAV
jgi:hypothetical protein